MEDIMEELLTRIKKMYSGVTTQEQLVIADTFCELLMSTAPEKYLDELVDCASMCQETAKIIIKVNEVNEKYNKSVDDCDCITPCAECKCYPTSRFIQ